MYKHTVVCVCLTERSQISGLPNIVFDVIHETENKTLRFKDMAEILYNNIKVKKDGNNRVIYLVKNVAIPHTESNLLDTASWDFTITKTEEKEILLMIENFKKLDGSNPDLLMKYQYRLYKPFSSGESPLIYSCTDHSAYEAFVVLCGSGIYIDSRHYSSDRRTHLDYHQSIFFDCPLCTKDESGLIVNVQNLFDTYSNLIEYLIEIDYDYGYDSDLEYKIQEDCEIDGFAEYCTVQYISDNSPVTIPEYLAHLKYISETVKKSNQTDYAINLVLKSEDPILVSLIGEYEVYLPELTIGVKFLSNSYSSHMISEMIEARDKALEELKRIVQDDTDEELCLIDEDSCEYIISCVKAEEFSPENVSISGTAEWISVNNNPVLLMNELFRCSNCGYMNCSENTVKDLSNGILRADDSRNFFYPPALQYCPNCTSRMKNAYFKH